MRWDTSSKSGWKHAKDTMERSFPASYFVRNGDDFASGCYFPRTPNISSTAVIFSLTFPFSFPLSLSTPSILLQSRQSVHLPPPLSKPLLTPSHPNPVLFPTPFKNPVPLLKSPKIASAV